MSDKPDKGKPSRATAKMLPRTLQNTIKALEDLRKDTNGLQEYEKLLNENASLKQELQARVNENQTLQQQVTTLEGRVDSLQVKNDLLKEEFGKKYTDWMQGKAHHDRDKEEMARLKQRAERAEQDGLRASRDAQQASFAALKTPEA
jgi:hypothetical protein